jgi:hypothetical protein
MDFVIFPKNISKKFNILLGIDINILQFLKIESYKKNI